MVQENNCNSLWDEATTMLVVALRCWLRLLGLQLVFDLKSWMASYSSLWVSG